MKLQVATCLLLSMIADERSVFAAGNFPVLEAEHLNEQSMKLPADFPESGTLLIVGFTKASQATTTLCGDRLEKAFPGRSYSMAVLEGIPFFIKGTVKKAIRASIPAERKDRYLFLYDGKKTMKLAAGFDEKSEDDAYIIGIGKKVAGSDERVMTSVTHGNCDDAQMEKLKKTGE